MGAPQAWAPILPAGAAAVGALPPPAPPAPVPVPRPVAPPPAPPPALAPPNLCGGAVPAPEAFYLRATPTFDRTGPRLPALTRLYVLGFVVSAGGQSLYRVQIAEARPREGVALGEVGYAAFPEATLRAVCASLPAPPPAPIPVPRPVPLPEPAPPPPAPEVTPPPVLVRPPTTGPSPWWILAAAAFGAAAAKILLRSKRKPNHRRRRMR